MARNTTAKVAHTFAINLISKYTNLSSFCGVARAPIQSLPGCKAFRTIDVDRGLEQDRPDEPVGSEKGESLIRRGRQLQHVDKFTLRRQSIMKISLLKTNLHVVSWRWKPLEEENGQSRYLDGNNADE